MARERSARIPKLKEVKKLRKEVERDPPVNADSILLRLYRRAIDDIYCMDCVVEDCSDECLDIRVIMSKFDVS